MSECVQCAGTKHPGRWTTRSGRQVRARVVPIRGAGRCTECGTALGPGDAVVNDVVDVTGLHLFGVCVDCYRHHVLDHDPDVQAARLMT